MSTKCITSQACSIASRCMRRVSSSKTVSTFSSLHLKSYAFVANIGIRAFICLFIAGMRHKATLQSPRHYAESSSRGGQQQPFKSSPPSTVLLLTFILLPTLNRKYHLCRCESESSSQEKIPKSSPLRNWTNTGEDGPECGM